ncbi:MAG: permease, partial [Burkholderiaceae bacterium]
AGELVPAIATEPFYPLLIGVLFIAGFAYSIVNGMLYKIVPFLVWYHLQSRMQKGQGKVPNVKKIVTDRVVRNQCIAHVVALLMMLAAVFLPQLFSRLAGAAFAVSSIWLWINLLGATLTYRRITRLQKTSRLSAMN